MSSECVDAEAVVPSSSPLPPSPPSLSPSPPFHTVITNHDGERKTTTQQVNTDFELGNLFFPRVFAGSLSLFLTWMRWGCGSGGVSGSMAWGFFCIASTGSFFCYGGRRYLSNRLGSHHGGRTTITLHCSSLLISKSGLPSHFSVHSLLAF